MKTRLLLLPLLALLFAACDSGSDEASDLDVLIGTHQAVKIEDNTGDQTTAFSQAVSAFTVALNANKTYRLAIDYNAAAEQAGRTDIDLNGTYTVNEAANTLVIQVPINATTQVPVSFTYEIVSNDTVRFTTPAGTFNAILGSNYQGNLVVTVRKQS